MEITKTTDYNLFKTIQGNRNLNQRHLAGLTISIMSKNMLDRNPIIVNDKMEIVDGQHRFEVAKNNNLPIYYLIMPGAKIEEVVRLNATNRAWNSKDYIESFAVRGNKDYTWLLEFVRDYDLSVSQALIFLYGNQGTTVFKTIKQGKFSPTEAQKETATKRADYFYEIRPFINRRGEVPKSFVRAFIVCDEEGLLDSVIAGVKKSGKSFLPETHVSEAVRQLKAFASL